MEDGTIPTDVSSEDPTTAQDLDQPTNTEPEISNDGDDGATAPREPIQTARERKLEGVKQKRIEEREEARKKAALMDNPDLTEEEYDAQQVAASEGDNSAPTSDDPEGNAEDGIGDVTPTAEDQPGGDDGDAPKAAVREGWELREDGVPIKKLKVNGQVRTFTEEEYDRMISKDLAGDDKLRLAAERERQLDVRQEQLTQRERQINQPPPADAGPEIDAVLDDFVDAVYEGNTDAAKEKIKAVIGEGRQSSTPNLDEIVSRTATHVSNTLEAERHRENLVDSWNKFESDYGDIASDPRLMAYADVVLKEVLEQNEGFSLTEVYLETGKRVRKDLNLPNPSDSPAPRADAKREERKANLKPVPKAGSAVNKPPKKPEVDMSPAAKIDRMRSSRALA